MVSKNPTPKVVDGNQPSIHQIKQRFPAPFFLKPIRSDAHYVRMVAPSWNGRIVYGRYHLAIFTSNFPRRQSSNRVPEALFPSCRRTFLQKRERDVEFFILSALAQNADTFFVDLT